MTLLDSPATYDPYDHGLDLDPYPTVSRLREERPLYRNEEHDFWALSRFEDVRSCLLDPKSYSSAKGVALELIKSDIEMPPGNVVFEDPPSHDAHRKMLARVFAPRRVTDLEPQIRALTVAALDAVEGRPTFDFVADLGALMPVQVIGLLLGLPRDQQIGLRERVEATLCTSDGGAMHDVDFTFGLADYVRWRLANPSDDIVTHLATSTFTDGDGVTRHLTEDELINYVAIIGVAGNETTTRLIGWAGHVLARHPEQRRMLVDDPGLIPNAIEEILRFETPVPVLARYVTRDVEHYGQIVPRGSAMLLLNAAANRDPRVFSDPDRFDIRRQIDRHIAFGHGIHFCLGAALARLEGRVALEEILKRYPTWELDHDNIELAHTSTVRGWHRLPAHVG